MTETKKLELANTAAFILMILLNGLANALPINGFTTGELSDMYPNLFVPAGVTFSIWGLIYLLLAVFIITQLLHFFETSGSNVNPEKYAAADFVPRIGWYFVINGLANALWIVVWHYQLPVVALGVMLIILWSLVRIYQNLGVGRREISPSVNWCAHIPFSVYLGWISVATIANVTTVLVDFGYDGGAYPEIWAITMICVAGLLGLWFLIVKNDYAYAAVIVWATYGIWLKRTSVEPVFESVAYTAAGTAALIVTAAVWWIILQKKYRKV